MAVPSSDAVPPLPKAIIFDFDGVLVDSEPTSLAQLRGALQDHGVAMSLDQVRETFLGASLTTIEAHLAERGGTTDGFRDRWYAALFAAFRQTLRPMPGAVDLLDALDGAGVPYCIASGGSVERLGVALDAAGLTARFEGRVFSADHVARGKPAPDLFLLAADRMGFAPEDGLVIEDSPAGVTAAVAAGIPVVGFLGGTHLDGIRSAHGAALTACGARALWNRFGPDRAASLIPT